jgi:sugar phosphate isomerase/epimerase
VKSAVTISLVPEARGGPFVFWDDLPAACRAAAELQFDALEVFPPSAQAIREMPLKTTLEEHGLQLVALGTGAGWVKHQLSLTSADERVRRRALDFVAGIIDTAADFGAFAIIGSMQGRWAPGLESEGRRLLADALETLGGHAARHGVPLIYEPLNRYETNFVNTIGAGVDLLTSLSGTNVRLLADLFHMNIEESDLPAAIRAGGRFIDHVHLADSNRRPAGNGHTDFATVADALRDIGYGGYVSAEAFPYPDSHAAARTTMDAFKRHFRS